MCRDQQWIDWLESARASIYLPHRRHQARGRNALLLGLLLRAGRKVFSRRAPQVMPTGSERLVSASGDGSTLPVSILRREVGAVICWEITCADACGDVRQRHRVYCRHSPIRAMCGSASIRHISPSRGDAIVSHATSSTGKATVLPTTAQEFDGDPNGIFVARERCLWCLDTLATFWHGPDTERSHSHSEEIDRARLCRENESSMSWDITLVLTSSS